LINALKKKEKRRRRRRRRRRREIREEFYNLLEQNINQIASSDTKIIPGDNNAKVGKENIHKPTIGNESLHNETNNNGIKMIQFVVSVRFKCKKYSISI